MRSPSAYRVASWEQGTRRWARAAAVVMLVGVVAESIAVRAVEEGAGRRWWGGSLISPSSAVLLVMSAAVWFSVPW